MTNTILTLIVGALWALVMLGMSLMNFLMDDNRGARWFLFLTPIVLIASATWATIEAAK